MPGYAVERAALVTVCSDTALMDDQEPAPASRHLKTKNRKKSAKAKEGGL